MGSRWSARFSWIRSKYLSSDDLMRCLNNFVRLLRCLVLESDTCLKYGYRNIQFHYHSSNRILCLSQELALYGEFTIHETLLYFGWISGLTTEAVAEKTDYLLNLLQLPDASRFVKSLSGGQQRRMSLAAALLHEPELLILDEPTVGVDPVLRKNIWDHLVELTTSGKRTVIITTHYIEETRQAHMVNFL